MQNTVILYDMENLIGGYGKKRTMDISLSKILSMIRSGGERTIIMQKAYGNWQVKGMEKFRQELQDLGISPVSVKHYGKTSAKNAADIKLVIDAMEILYTNPLIDTFVIVSGDGDFSSLVAALQSQGRRVITSAFKRNMSDHLKKVSDAFIALDDTLSEKELRKLVKKRQKQECKERLLENPLLGQTILDIKPINTEGIGDVLQQAVHVIRALYDNPQGRDILMENGIALSVFKEAMNYAVKSFDISNYGFTKLVDFTLFAIQGTPLKLIYKASGEYRLVDETVEIEGFEDADTQKAPIDVHTLANYDLILSQGSPRIVFPRDIGLFWEICDYLVERKEGYQNVGYFGILKDFQSILGLGELEARNILNMLITVRVFSGDNPMRPVKEQSFGLTVDDREEILSLIEVSASRKIKQLLGTVDSSILHNYLASFAQ